MNIKHIITEQVSTLDDEAKFAYYQDLLEWVSNKTQLAYIKLVIPTAEREDDATTQ